MRNDKGMQPIKHAGFSYDEFFARLTHWADARCGIEVTDRMLRDWCDERLLPGPTKTGLGRGKGFRANWDSLAYRRACRICRFKKQGATRFDEFRILLWLCSEHVNIKELRAACLGELAKHRSSVALSTRSNVDLTDPEPSCRTIKAFEKRGAEVDSRIVPANFKYGGQETLEMLTVLKSGETRVQFAQSLMAAVMPPSNVQFEFAPLVNIFRALLAEPDESQVSGENSLETAEAIHFKLARRDLGKIINFGKIFRNNPQALKNQLPVDFNLDPISNSFGGLMQQNFKIFMFLAFVCAIHRGEWPPQLIVFGKSEK